MSDEAKVRDEAYHNWIINVPPETEDATDAWNRWDDGATVRRFRAAIEDAFNGGWQAATARAQDEALNLIESMLDAARYEAAELIGSEMLFVSVNRIEGIRRALKGGA